MKEWWTGLTRSGLPEAFVVGLCLRPELPEPTEESVAAVRLLFPEEEG